MMTSTTLKIALLGLVIVLDTVSSEEIDSSSILKNDVIRNHMTRRSNDGLTWNLVRILVDEQRERQNLRKEFRNIKKSLDDVKRELGQKNKNLGDIRFQRKKVIEEVKNTKGYLKTELEKYLKEKCVILDSKITNISKTVHELTKKVAGIQSKGFDMEAKIVQNIKDENTTKKQLNNFRTRIDELEIEVSKKQPGAAYIRWGKITCPNNTDLIYTGRLGGTNHVHKAGPSNTQCLPDDPDYREHQSGDQGGLIYGVKFRLGAYSQRELLNSHNNHYVVVCAACQSRKNTAMIMIPGKSKCYDGWHIEYRGYLMADLYTHAASNFICVDAYPDVIRGTNGNTLQTLLYTVQSKCGSLKCPPYKDNYELTCVVCTR